MLKALEPDRCYYIANFERIATVEVIDLERDPPPDLIVEVEVSRSLLNRMSILAALGVPEVWRLSETRVEVNLLQSGQYVASDESPTFPGIPLQEVFRFFQIGRDQGDWEMMQSFQKWLRTHRRKKKRSIK